MLPMRASRCSTATRFVSSAPPAFVAFLVRHWDSRSSAGCRVTERRVEVVQLGFSLHLAQSSTANAAFPLSTAVATLPFGQVISRRRILIRKSSFVNKPLFVGTHGRE